MRPLRLDLHGFTVFHEPTTVDFTDADFFALVGPTGSGKSTVLDAICFALYGTVPRWGDRRRIENALAPSAAQAKVRLVFESCGARFVATRVVRRDSKGRVSTSHAGLEQLPPGFDLALFDTAPAERGEAPLGTVLAGTPVEMEAAVIEAVGLPYEQFTSCVVLPQGEFARFLHAKPAERQEILVNLLGLHVYQRIGERATALHREAEAATAATRSLLGDVSGADDAALAAAARSVAAAQALITALDDELPALAEASAAGEQARTELARVQGQLETLGTVKVPAGVATLAAEVVSAQAAAQAAQTAVLDAEEYEEKLRAELSTAGDRTQSQRLVDTYAEFARVSGQVTDLAARAERATDDQRRALTILAKARKAAEKAGRDVVLAQQAVEAAQTADRAASLRIHLVAGEPCPVCEQPVTTVPAMPETPALRTARTGLAAAEKTAQATAKTVDDHDRTARELERALAVASTQHGEAVALLHTRQAQLTGAPELSTVHTTLGRIAAAERAVAAAADAVRTARKAARAGATTASSTQDRLNHAWRTFDQVRDAVAPLGPPPTERDDLVGSWQALHTWAHQTRAERERFRDEVLGLAEVALITIADRAARIDALFRDAGVATSRATGDPAEYRQAAALAAERANAAQQRVVERREQAQRLADQVAQLEKQAQVAKLLALHLRADRFERWLLTEALDVLVAGASRILRDLSAGQYDLDHDKGEFFVIDHADAGLRRGVRTLSGGETFQASLALALALSEQLAGLSTSATQLESIMLDEGFGTLDATSLDVVAATLENLAAKGDRVVGVVTHVAALAERIPVRFEVTKDARGNATVVRTS